MVRIGFLCIGFLLVTETSFAQRKPMERVVTLSVREQKIGDVLEQITKQAEVFFAFNSQLIKANQRFTIDETKKTIGYVLERLFAGTNLSYKTIDEQIIIYLDNKKFLVEKANVTGHVFDQLSGDPIVGVNVFVAGTLKGCSTDQNGLFLIKDMERGDYEVVFSHIAYDIKVSKLSVLGNRKVISEDVELMSRVQTLEEIEVVSRRDKEWQGHLAVFEDQFLGKTQNSTKCAILNGDDLEFYYDKDQNSLIAKSTDPIVVINQALGYKLEYYLKHFEIKEGRSELVGVSKFEELETKRRKEKKRWAKSRRKSYKGSLTHFLKALVNNDLAKQGFRVFTVEDLPGFNEINVSKVSTGSLVSNNEGNISKQISFDNYLKVEYTDETESLDYIEDQVRLAVINENKYLLNFYRSALLSEKRKAQTSYVKLNLPVVTINPKGFFNEPLAITTYGYWSWERVAEYLPFEYDVK